MTSHHNEEARQIISTAIEASVANLARLEEALEALGRKRFRLSSAIRQAKEEISGLTQALDALGGPLPQPEQEEQPA